MHRCAVHLGREVTHLAPEISMTVYLESTALSSSIFVDGATSGCATDRTLTERCWRDTDERSAAKLSTGRPTPRLASVGSFAGGRDAPRLSSPAPAIGCLNILTAFSQPVGARKLPQLRVNPLLTTRACGKRLLSGSCSSRASFHNGHTNEHARCCTPAVPKPLHRSRRFRAAATMSDSTRPRTWQAVGGCAEPRSQLSLKEG
eukprot:365720-Chlamydomonas_euryale.AAC.9